jgi:hypothetical protein
MRIALVLALVLALAPAAAAKEITKAEVCGPDGCSTVSDHGALAVIGNGGPPRTPPTAAPYYDVRITVAEAEQDFTWSYAAVPSRHAQRADDGTWMEMPPDVTALVRKYAAGRRPYPSTEMVGWAAPPVPKPAAAADSPVWPEGLVIVLVALAGALAARAVWLRGAARRA